jgi:hypothetical protein
MELVIGGEDHLKMMCGVMDVEHARLDKNQITHSVKPLFMAPTETSDML